MFPMTLFFIVVPVLVVILLVLNLLLAPHNPDNDKLSTFECGFAPISGQTRQPYYINFFRIAILFLCFDLDIFFLFPYPTSGFSTSVYGYAIFIIFNVVLAVGFIYELGHNVLDFSLNKPKNKDNS